MTERTKQAVFIHSPEIERYAYPPECPFRSERAGMTRQILASMQLLSGSDRAEVAPTLVSPEALGRFHTTRYLEAMRRAEAGHLDVDGLFMGLGTPDTPIFTGMTDYALLACGATLAAVDAVASGRAHAAFNPSGGLHHAAAEKASGFCYLNDVVVGCMALAAQGKRTLFLDIDVHHCDGVQDAFYDRSDVMTVSLHESGRTLFPGTGAAADIGEGEGEGYSVNVPLPVGTYDEAYLKAFEEVVMPLADAFDPDVIVLELGMDALSGDPLAHLDLTNATHAEVVRRMMELGKPLAAVGGGGYHPENTARGWALAWSILCREDFHHLAAGLGGVMLQSTDWHAGLQDHDRPPEPHQVAAVAPVVDATIDEVKRRIFPIHGLQ